MKESSFEHKFGIGTDVLYPQDGSLKEGSIDEVVFHKQEIRGRGDLEYLIVPNTPTSSKRDGVLRDEDDVVAA